MDARGERLRRENAALRASLGTPNHVHPRPAGPALVCLALAPPRLHV